MRFSTSTVISALLGAAAVSAETFNVLVGKEGALTYEPATVNAKVGDVISFQFLSKNHTVTQSTFTSPCVPKGEGVDSGFQFVPAAAAQIPAWSITINNDTAPLWFFCNQGAHCRAGMVFSVNPSAEKTHQAFLTSANAGGGATSGPNSASSSSGGAGYGGAAGGSGSSGASSPATTPATGAANAGSVPSSGSDTSASQQNAPSPGAAVTSKSVQVGWMLAGVVGAALLL